MKTTIYMVASAICDGYLRTEQTATTDRNQAMAIYKEWKDAANKQAHGDSFKTFQEERSLDTKAGTRSYIVKRIETESSYQARIDLACMEVEL